MAGPLDIKDNILISVLSAHIKAKREFVFIRPDGQDGYHVSWGGEDRSCAIDMMRMALQQMEDATEENE